MGVSPAHGEDGLLAEEGQADVNPHPRPTRTPENAGADGPGCLGIIVWLVFAIVSSRYLAVWADDLFVFVFYHTDAPGRGLRVVDWKQGILSNGEHIPQPWNFLRVLMMFIPWALLCAMVYFLIDKIEVWWKVRRGK
jgi:hypothetical protein